MAARMSSARILPAQSPILQISGSVTRQDPNAVSSICSMLISANMLDYKYHRFYKAAVLKNLKFIGLNECYIRSMNKERYIERRVAYEQFYKFINSLEVENVDLVTELHDFLKDRPDIGQLNDMAALEVAKHFFRLGLKTGERR